MMMLSNSLQWPNKIGAQRKAAHPSSMGRLHWSAQRCAEQQKVRKFGDQLDAYPSNGCAPTESPTVVRRVTDLPTVLPTLVKF